MNFAFKVYKITKDIHWSPQFHLFSYSVNNLRQFYFLVNVLVVLFVRSYVHISVLIFGLSVYSLFS